MFDDSIKFKYPWRPYQAKVLEDVNGLIKDKKIHIVAAPGSGKTVLGLELARRIGKPVLILSPTVTIKNQWIDRFVTSFMVDGSSKPEWISDDIYNLNFFNSVTYQGLHCAYKKLTRIVSDNDDTDDEVEKETINTEIDVKNYNLISEIKKQGIKTIVLDEAHHLKKEWWNSLTKVVEAIPDVVIISLTATPPYDIEQNEWKRYVSLCGDIDAEISVPELVKAKNLCPHQDYVYFSYPTNSEREMIKKYQDEVEVLINELITNTDFINLIRNHPYFKDSDVYIEEILENPKFYSSMLIYLNAAGIVVTKEHVKVLGHTKDIPALDARWMEVLLQNIIFDSRDTFKDIEFLSLIEKRLHEMGAIEKKEVLLTNNSNLQKLFINSISKLDSIVNIVKSEYSNMSNKLRMVILTDYLRKEYLELEIPEIKTLGVFPILLKLLSSGVNINMAVLTGSIFMIPVSMKDRLLEEAKLVGINEDKISFESLKYIDSYVIVKSTGKLRSKLMNVISKLFSVGEINIIIGTKSLLGEGWDEQSINSLVLASFVGSYVLSNQMRGRAIRVSSDPMKSANVWHLVCVTDINRSLIDNADYDTMKRRFNSFVGIGYNEDVLESGIDRLDTIPKYFSKENIDLYNSNLTTLSNKRDEMYNRWFNLVDKYKSGSRIVNETMEVSNTKMKNDFSVIDPIRILWFVLSATFLYLVANTLGGMSDAEVEDYMFMFIILLITTIVINIPFIIQCIRVWMFSVPKNQLRYVAKCLIKSLCEADLIDTPYYSVKVKIQENKEDNKLHFIIDGVNSRDKVLIINSLEEIFSKIEDQRYILVNKKFKISTYYSVPSVLSVNKELATIFHKNWTKYVGNSNLVYTKNSTGREILLKARKNSFTITDDEEIFGKKKKAISDWE